MVESYVREMLDSLLRALEDVNPNLRDVRDLRRSPDYERIIGGLTNRIFHDLERKSPSQFWLLREEYERTLWRQSAQLDRIERLLSENTTGCRFAEGRDGGSWFAELITLKPGYDKSDGVSSGNMDADPVRFIYGVEQLAQKTTSVVIMDPYALAGKDEADEKTSTIDLIYKIVSLCCDLDPVQLHLYCRSDIIDYKEWENLEKKLKPHKLSVYVGDFHDRYILFGQGRNVNGSDKLSRPWHGKEYWSGLAFGASLNGIAKRPTYVLGLKKVDIIPLIAYIRGVVSNASDRETSKQAQKIRDKEKEDLAKAKLQQETERLRQEIIAEIKASLANSPNSK